MITKLSMGLACAAVAIGASRAGADVVRLAVRSQPQHDARLGITYGFSHSTDGGIDMSAEAADLQVRKTSYEDGHFVLRLASQDDVVTITLGVSTVEVVRGKRRVSFAHGTAVDADLDGARTLLLGSRAVRRFRQLAIELEDAEDDSPAPHGLLIAASIVHALDGDPGAPSRIARRLARGRSTPALRRVASWQDPNQKSEDCWVTYEQRVTQAMRDYEDCLRTRQWWNFEPQGNMCVGVWAIRVEGYWFQYIKCSAFPF